MVSLDRAQLFSLEGRTALLTGAGGFLGRTLAETLLANGARVVALGRSERLMDAVAGWAAVHGADRVAAHRVDMYDANALQQVLEQVARSEQVSIVVNNAHEMGPATGFNSAEGRIERADQDQWMRNLTGGAWWPALTSKVLGEGMKERDGGSIVNIASMYGLVAPNPRLYEGTEFVNPPGYSAAKAAMLAVTRYLASFWGSYGVRANAIVPGPFSNTEDDGPNAVPEDDPFLQRLAERTALGRVGRPEELAGALLFLASDASSYVTGQAVVVDGGWTIT
jgi:NAD(P)-dependent dehydrogenase (short-subunit alcohol dehydrogenase family)